MPSGKTLKTTFATTIRADPDSQQARDLWAWSVLLLSTWLALFVWWWWRCGQVSIAAATLDVCIAISDQAAAAICGTER